MSIATNMPISTLAEQGVVDVKPDSRTDEKVMFLLLLPAFCLAGFLYWLGVREIAFGLAAVAFGISVIISPAVGLYAYFMWQALDAAAVQEADAVITPAKIFAPFLLAVYVLWMLRPRKPIVPSRTFINVMVAYGAFGLLMAPASLEILAAFRYGSQVIVQALLVVMALHVIQTRRQLSWAALFLWLGGVILSLAVIFGEGSSRSTRATFGEHANPNTTAMALTIALAAIPIVWSSAKRKILCIGLVASAPLLLFAQISTGSRSALIAVVGAVVIGPFIAGSSGFIKKIGIVVLGVGAVVYSFSVVVGSSGIDTQTKDRLEALVHGGDAGHTESRTYIWKNSIKVFAHRPIVGCGMGNSVFGMQRYAGMYADIHSSILGVLIETGVIGASICLCAVCLLFRAVRKAARSRYGVPAAMMFVLVLLSGTVHTIHYSKWFWVPITFCCLLSEHAVREREEAIAAGDGPGG